MSIRKKDQPKGSLDAERIAIRKVDYEAFAKESGLNAYRRARENGLSIKVAKEFKRIFGAPVPSEHRFS